MPLGNKLQYITLVVYSFSTIIQAVMARFTVVISDIVIPVKTFFTQDFPTFFWEPLNFGGGGGEGEGGEGEGGEGEGGEGEGG